MLFSHRVSEKVADRVRKSKRDPFHADVVLFRNFLEGADQFANSANCDRTATGCQFSQFGHSIYSTLFYTFYLWRSHKVIKLLLHLILLDVVV